MLDTLMQNDRRGNGDVSKLECFLTYGIAVAVTSSIINVVLVLLK